MELALRKVNLDDKYTLDDGQIFLNGTQALVRLPLIQKQLDLAQGLNTAGFISGYRGSPLGGFDQALWKAKAYLQEAHIRFTPGVNEDLGATAVWGSQQVHLSPGANVDGVFAMWYGKGPGVDRTGDVFKHANAAGTSRLGGVLALAGDDHACKSSTLPHQSEFAFIDAFIPVMHPANVQDVLDLGIYGWAMSRYSGLWVGFKVISDTVDTSASVRLSLNRYQIQHPNDFILPPGGLNLRWPDAPLDQEKRLHEYKLKACQAFVRANHLNRVVWDLPKTQARLGLIAVGKGYLDLRQALEDLGITQDVAQSLGLKLMKITVSWPLEKETILEFCQDLQEVIVIEEKRPLIEAQLKEYLYHIPADRRPAISGKTTPSGEPLLPTSYELSGSKIAAALAKRFSRYPGFEVLDSRLNAALKREEEAVNYEAKLVRLPFYCSGCPHNTSTTQLPEGSRALAGIGCHYMATWIDHRTQTFTQMGGEGVPWIGTSPFTDEDHIFANLGDGTYYHSGLLAIRAAVAAKVNITYKILYNDAVAMTGGQPVDGPLSVADITKQVYAEGVRRIALVADDPHKYPMGMNLAPGTTIHSRDQLMAVQEDLKQWKGVSALIYDQTCAAEKRRRRKRGLMEDPNKRIFINETVCEGCGDCGQKSNCLSVIPLETEWGRKRAIDQSSCNKDYSCVKGFCPSFVSVIGGSIRKPSKQSTPKELFDHLKAPTPLPLSAQPYNIFITGVGGTGVITIGSLLGMAAHLEGKGCSVVDMAGLAQKGGAVVTHVRLSQHPDQIHATRIYQGEADLLLGFDMVVSSTHEGLSRIKAGHTQVVINDHETITSQFTKNPDYVFPRESMRQALKEVAGDDHVHFINATELATSLMGDSLMTNLFMVGYALQKGLIPLSSQALIEAIKLNGVAVEENIAAFNWGRLAVEAMESVHLFTHKNHGIDPDHIFSGSIEEMIQRRAQFLINYQDEAYAQRYLKVMDQVKTLDTSLQQERLTKTVAQTYFRLMAYKDEYEVARLYTDGAFLRRLKEQFEGDVKLQFHLAPPLLAKKDPKTGHLQKMTFGPWMLKAFKILARLKRFRGTKFDVFGYTKERKMERQLIVDFEVMIQNLMTKITPDNYNLACEIAALPQKIRGFGHVKEKNYEEFVKTHANLWSQFISR